MLPVFAALLQQSANLPELKLEQGPREGLTVRLGDQAIIFAPKGSLFTSSGSLGSAMGTDVPAKPVFLGYPHGPKTSEFVPAGRMARTYEIRVKGPLDADVRASADSFACNDRVESVLGSVYGHPSSGADNGIYDRKDDWLLTVDSGVVSAVKNGHYRVHFGAGESVIRIRPSYYRNHLGYFLWDNSRSNWKTPVAGWCSWMAHLQGVTEKNVVDAAKFFSANLKDYGYGIIQIDDGYQRVSQFPDGDVAVKEPFAHYWTIPNEKFPSGLKSLASTISGLGMTPGIWVGDYLPAGLNHKEGYVQDADGKPHKGPWVNYAMNGNDAAAIDEAYVNTVRELRADGWRYFKIDTLRHVLYDSYRQVPEYWQKRGESMEEAYRKILASTKKAAGADNYLLACWGTIPELAGIPDGARIGEDVGPDVASMRRSAKYIAQFQHLNDVVWRNDPDYMCLRVPVAQAQAWATLTFLAGGHVMVSDPISDYDAARLDVLRRVGPPLVTRPSSVVPHGPDPEFMTLRAEKDGEEWTVAARFGWGSAAAVSVPLSSLGLPSDRPYLAFDFWHEKFLGVVQGSAPFDALADGACQAISLRPSLGHPQVLGTNRHLGQGVVELSGVRWSGHALSGRFHRVAGRAWSVYAYVPAGFSVEGSSGAEISRDGDVLKLTFAEGSTAMDWEIRFRKPND